MTLQPRRIQRKRIRGFRLADSSNNPNGYRYVGRPTPWGNPYLVGDPDPATCEPMTAADAVFWFKSDFDPAINEPFDCLYKILQIKDNLSYQYPML